MDTRTEQNDFLNLISANMGIIRKICYSYCFTETDRKDLAQEIIIVLWKGSKKYNPDLKFSTWMYKVALNVAISFYRNSKKTIDTVPFTDTHFEIEDHLLEASESEANFNLLQRHISTLKELDKALIILYFEEKSYKEIAEIVGISETNVATKVSRIKEKLKLGILSEKK
ncbi:MAG TPA: sigma-70 family RNA polymerase sigma factor [Waddliaceae bacterium]